MNIRYSLATGYVTRNPGIPLEIPDEDLEGLDEDARNEAIGRAVEDHAIRNGLLEWTEDK